MFFGRIDNSQFSQTLDKSAVRTRGLTAGRATKPAQDGPDEFIPPQKDGEAGFTGFVIIRLKDAGGRQLDVIDNLAKLADAARMRDLAKVIEQFDLAKSRRVITSIKPGKLREMEAAASHTKLPPLRSLSNYWRVDMRGKAERIEEVIKILNALPEVDQAYRDLQGSDPLVNAANDTYNAQQDYLDAAPDGIDARWAWTQPNGEGAGAAVIDMEQGWFLTHEDFTTKAPSIVFGDNRDGVGTYVGNHGTAVLGEMIADDNDLGVVGIAPSVGSVRCSSHYDAASDTGGHAADAIIGAVAVMSAGDMLLIEYQTSFQPAEIVDENFDAIRLASALGIVVFEAAGNGNMNLDSVTNAAGLEVLNPASADFRDSGAIIVGAAIDTVPHDRKLASNFGERVNCFGWGQNVVTCGYGDLDNGGGSNDGTYAGDFQNTSAATPIVAGAGLIVQGMHEANTGARLSPEQMRLLLSNPATGTAQGPNVAGNIGVMPDLRGIIEDTLGLNADVYLRDNIGDDGTVPTTGGISGSPDIIVRPVQVADKDAAFGEGSGSENSTTLGFEAEAGQDNFIYVRMKNRGAVAANNVTARVFWSEVSTLVTPDMWNEIGVTNPVNVPVGDTLEVADPLTWAEAEIPAPGHYCYVGILDHAADPAPPTPPATDWDGFRAFIRNQNNVTWRNFNVVDNIADPSADPTVMPFLIANAPDRRRRFDFAINQRLADGVEAALELPLAIAKPFMEGIKLKVEVNRDDGVAVIRLPHCQRLFVPGVLLPAKARFKCRFIVKGTAKHARPGNMISIGQFFAEQEVGRVSWQFSRRRDPKAEC